MVRDRGGMLGKIQCYGLYDNKRKTDWADGTTHAGSSRLFGIIITGIEMFALAIIPQHKRSICTIVFRA
jgi:hypothetical protein